MIIAIACPNRDDFKGETVGTLFNLGIQASFYCKTPVPLIQPQTAFIDESRNKAWDIAKAMNVDWLLMVDSDISLVDQSMNAVGRLMSLGKDLVTGVYVDRGYPYRPHVYNFGAGGVINIPEFPEEPFKCDAAGAGFFLISKKVMDAFTPEVIEKYGKPFDILNYGKPNVLKEDVAFCWRIKQIGFELWADPRIPLAHLGKMAFTVEHWQYMKNNLKAQYDNGIEGWMSDNELSFLSAVATKMDSIVELGSHKGRSAKALLDGCKGTVTCVDIWDGKLETGKDAIRTKVTDGDLIYQEFLNNVGHYPNLKIIRSDSREAAINFPDKSIDMVFIDASHDYESVKADIEAWLPKVKKMICGHDYSYGWPEVMKAVQEKFPDAKVVESIWFKEVA